MIAVVRSVAALCAVGVVSVLAGWAMPAPELRAQPAATGPGVKGVRVAECKICHSSLHEGLEDYVKQFQSDKFISFDTVKQWKTGGSAADAKYAGDPHKYIFNALDPAWSPAAAKMQAVLGAGKPDYTLATDTRCLTCHAVDTVPESSTKKLDQFVRDSKVGMGCTACHGLEGDWLYKHYSAVGDSIPWRTTTPADKAKQGMMNLRDPAVKATMCASCHVGSGAEGKVVTHEMYAAGHPWLPPFELASFLENEPLHWALPEQLPALFAQGEKAAQELFRVRSGDQYFTRHLAVGAVASLKAEMEQLSHESKKLGSGQTLDFARFDCAACHHELMIPSARQKNGYADRVPGRIPLKSWTGVLPEMIVRHADAGQLPAYQAKWAAVKKAAYSRPFGDPAALASASGEMAQWCDTMLKTVNVDGVLYDAAATAKLREQLAARLSDANKNVGADPEAATQLIWAYRAVTPAAERSKLDRLKPLLPTELRGGQVQWLQIFSNPQWGTFPELWQKP
ncbi:MAG: hypothetical protein ACRCZF_16800 [Gemmataceae bacterium]